MACVRTVAVPFWVLVLVLGTRDARAGGPAHDIGWHWPGSGPTVYRFTRFSEERTPAPGRDPVFITEVIQRVAHDVVGEEPAPVEGDRAPGATPVRLTWERVRYVDRPHATVPVEFDSDTTDVVPNPSVALAAASVGSSVTCLFGPDGAIAGVEDRDGYLRGMEFNLGRWGLAGDRTFEGLQRMFTPEVVAAGTEPMYAFLPGGPAGVGASHEVTRVLTLPKVGLVRTRETHTLLGITTDAEGRRLAEFGVAGVVEWPEPEPALAERFNVSIAESAVTGSWSYDLGLGLPLVGTLELTFTADVVHYDPRDRSSAEFETIQRVVDTLDWLGDGPTLTDDVISPGPTDLGGAQQSP